MPAPVQMTQVAATEAVRAKVPDATLWGCRLTVCARTTQELQLDSYWSPLAARWNGLTKQDVQSAPVAAAYCDFYRRLGLRIKDHPPSAVNLVQRFLLRWQPGRVRSINPLVDAGNIASAESLIPIALLDAQHVEGQLRLDLAQPGDHFLGFGMDAVEAVAPGTVVLRDAAKVVSLFCYRDGQATAVSDRTNHLQLLACQVSGVEPELVHAALQRAIGIIEAHYDTTVS